MNKETIKYTTDGKKVVVIGDLNQTEKIVQEIYVTDDGCEIPQGERFVVTSLLDSPAKSWKEKELDRLESRYERESKAWETKIYQLIKEKESAYAALSNRVKWLRNVAKEPQMKSLNIVLNTIADFMDGSVKWVLINDWSYGYVLEKFDDNGISNIMNNTESGDCGSMRLLSLFGDSNGNFDFKVSNYSDGSGSDKRVLFFRSRDEALKHIQDKINNKSEYNCSDLETLKKYQLNIDMEKYNKYQEGLIKNSSKRIEDLKISIENEKKVLEKLKSSIQR